MLMGKGDYVKGDMNTLKRKILHASSQNQKSKPKYIRQNENVLIGSEPIKEKQSFCSFFKPTTLM